MKLITYRIEQHDGGWAYRLGDTWSETFRDHLSATAAARHAASEQKVPGRDAYIEYENADGEWISERADGHDRPLTEIEG